MIQSAVPRAEISNVELSVRTVTVGSVRTDAQKAERHDSRARAGSRLERMQAAENLRRNENDFIAIFVMDDPSAAKRS
jgi:hypothetical protein